MTKKLIEKLVFTFFSHEFCDSDKIVNAYLEYRGSDSGRNVSAIKRKPNCETNVLYVGKVKNHLGGRMVTHMGYGPAKTGGLQLAHWARAIGLQLSVHIYAFDNALGDFVNPLELDLTKRLNPLIGKSK